MHSVLQTRRIVCTALLYMSLPVAWWKSILTSQVTANGCVPDLSPPAVLAPSELFLLVATLVRPSGCVAPTRRHCVAPSLHCLEHERRGCTGAADWTVTAGRALVTPAPDAVCIPYSGGSIHGYPVRRFLYTYARPPPPRSCWAEIVGVACVCPGSSGVPVVP